MSRNRRRHNHTNKVPLGALSSWLLVALIFLAGGMTWVYFKNNEVHAGGEQKRLERQRELLLSENRAVKALIHELRSFSSIQKRYADGYVNLVPITAEAIVRVDTDRSYQRIAGGRLMEGEVRPVANRGGAQ